MIDLTKLEIATGLLIICVLLIILVFYKIRPELFSRKK